MIKTVSEAVSEAVVSLDDRNSVERVQVAAVEKLSDNIVRKIKRRGKEFSRSNKAPRPGLII